MKTALSSIDVPSLAIGACFMAAVFAAWDARDTAKEFREQTRMTEAYIFSMHKACLQAGVDVPSLPATED